jgi:tetraacyldisaccharide 4'-kinase
MRKMNLPLFNRIESIMLGRDAGSWPLLRHAMSLLSVGYGLAAQKRRRRVELKQQIVQKLPCPVISVGNITLGGTGKSPMTVYIARLLQRQGFRPAVLSRGYRGGAEKSGGVVSDGFHILLDADMAGDEPLMMAQQLKGVPVLVGKDRYRSGMKAIQAFSSNVLVLDDAFQHLRLFRDVNLVLLDDEQPFGNGWVVPAGPLREPVSALRAADAILLTRCKMDVAPQSMRPAGIPPEMPVFRSYHRASIRSVQPAEKNQTIQAKWFSIQPILNIDLSGCRMFAFSGIARNADFQKSVQDIGCQPIGFLEYSDHHHYSSTDIEYIVRNAVDHQADMLVTTEKDACRLAGRFEWPLPMGIVGIDIALPEPDATDFSCFLQDRLASSLKFSSHRTS